MLALSFSLLWNINFFFLYIYSIFIISLIFFLLPVTKNIIYFSKLKNLNNFEYITGNDLHSLFSSLFFFLIIISLSWSSHTISSWFGHLIFSSFQYKITFFIIFFFYSIIFIYSNSFYYSSKEIYDYLIVNINFFFWIIILFFSNTFFTVIFLIELLSTLIFLLIITSTFSTTYYYNNLNLNLHNYFHSTTPFFFVQTLMYFFWISLISSLNLFFSLILFYINFLTLDWYFFEFIFYYLISIKQIKEFFFFLFIWFNFLFCFFLKCGLVPFYFWKPTFFKGIPLHSLFFYITFYYFFIFLFFIIFFLIYTNEIFYYFLLINILLLVIGFTILLFILLEAYYIKTFLAISSILNTLFIFLTLNSLNVIDVFFFF